MLRHRSSLVRLLLGLLLAALFLWRASLIGVGPDQDSDAYGHHGISRQLLVEPTDLRMHWVWLPLFHVLGAGVVLLGGTMETVRVSGNFLTALLPMLLFSFLEKREGTLFAFAAAALTATCPISMQMGTTAQPEPLFAVCILGTVMLLSESRFVLGGLVLTAAALLRYEAWAAIFGVLIFLIWKRNTLPKVAALALVFPLSAILLWAFLRKEAEGSWFLFLRETKTFANDALKQKSAFELGGTAWISDLLLYPAFVPHKVLGPAVFLAPLGVIRLLRRGGLLFLLVHGACLGFLTLTWMLRSSLGLDRHFVVMVPLYGALIVHGVVLFLEGLSLLVRRISQGGRRPPDWLLPASLALSLAFFAADAWPRLSTWMGHWRASLASGYPAQREVGAYLRTLPEGATIYCDEATLEILSGLDRKRFDRHWVDEPGARERMVKARDSEGAVYVATWTKKLSGLRDLGPVLYSSGEISVLLIARPR